MDFVTNSAALGGILSVVFTAWAFGRLQGGFADADAGPGADLCGAPHADRLLAAHPCPDAALSCSQDNRAACWAAINDPASLGALHAEISAYRRAEQIFAAFGREDFALKPSLNREPRERCDFGLIIEDACGVPGDDQQASDRIEPCSTLPPQAAGAI